MSNSQMLPTPSFPGAAGPDQTVQARADDALAGVLDGQDWLQTAIAEQEEMKLADRAQRPFGWFDPHGGLPT